MEQITGNLYDQRGGLVGDPNTELLGFMAPKSQAWLSRTDLASLFGAEWEGEAMLEVADSKGLKLMNINFVGVAPKTLKFENAYDWGALVAPGTYTADIWSNPEAYIVKAPDGSLSRVSTEEEARRITGASAPAKPTIEEEIKLNKLDGETFFNFSCFENSESGRVYLQTNSNSDKTSLTHIINTGDQSQQFTGTLFASDGIQLGQADQPLHSEVVASKGRLILSSEMIEEAFSIGPWEGPALLEVKGTESFELVTKLKGPSGVTSNTNCARQAQVHNIEGSDSTDLTFLRLVNAGDYPTASIKGSLFDKEGAAIGDKDTTLLDGLGAKQQVWLNRNDISDLFGGWNGEAVLNVEGGEDLWLLNLNYVNNETFLNFSCYEASN